MTQRAKIFTAATVVAVCFIYLLYTLCRSRTLPVIDRPWSIASEVKYILLWSPRDSPLDLLEIGSSTFIINNCHYNNCYVTDNKNYLYDLTEFDALVFNSKVLTSQTVLPSRRAPHQKYVFASTESSHYYRICDNKFKNYFNWTWTYKLDSDIRWGYIAIYDLNDRLIGPKIDMVWPKLDPISEELKVKLKNKTKGAAWFVSNCRTLGKREDLYTELQNEMLSLGYSWTIDVYGACGKYSCPRSSEKECEKMVEDHYYFYFSFENSFSEDYVTEKLLTALNHYAIPIVYGTANYSR
jgi:alpha-1,3-fucosyltransferase